MRALTSTFLLSCAAILSFALTGFAQTQLYTNIHTFAGLDGANPITELVEASDGALYGVCVHGGTSNLGTIFTLNRDGSSFAVLHHFGAPGDGAGPRGLIEATDGALYGTTYQGGTSNLGTVFRLEKGTRNYTVLCNLTNCRNPYKGVIEGSDGVLYGTSSNSGLSSYGSIFRVNKDGSNCIRIYDFTPAGGFTPFSAVFEASDGRLYGTTYNGGENSWGTVYGLDKNGSNFQVLHSFGFADAQGSYAEVTEGTDGALYGTTMLGGTTKAGAVFKISKDGTAYTILHNFGTGYANDGTNAYPAPLQGSDGLLYGTTSRGGTSGGGTIFKLANDGTDYSVIYNFGSVAADGQEPIAFPREGADGALYGTASVGGDGYGTVYRLTGPGSPFLSIRLSGTNTAIISWASPATEFHLEQNPDLGSLNWTPVLQIPTNDGKLISVAVPLTSTSMVYRLKSQ